MRKDWQEIPGFLVVINDIMDLSVNAAINRMNQPVPLPTARVLEERRGKDAFPLRRKSDIHRIIHPAGHDRLDNPTLGPTSKNMRRARYKRLPVWSLVGLLRERAFAPVNPSIES